MKLIRYLFFIIIVLGLNCDARTEEVIEKTTFQFDISGDIKGKLTQKFGRTEIKCEAGRTIISFFENMDTRPDTSDMLIGEIHLGIQVGDSTGTYTLKGITEKRNHREVGFLSLLNSLIFDDLSAQYINQTERFQNIITGSIEIERWSSQSEGIIKGHLKASISEEGKNIEIKGKFAIIVANIDEVCIE